MGVWIETSVKYKFRSRIKVTPFVGVWIETRKLRSYIGVTSVTPFVGVWIETLSNMAMNIKEYPSHPSWVCGLKLMFCSSENGYNSHTLRGCVD